MIFFLSCTGNTKWAAETLGRATGERLVDIASVVGGECSFSLEDGERIGFCFPVHGWRPPKIVRRFVGKLSLGDAAGHYCYALCTAGDNIGETMDIFRKDIAAVGLVLHSAFSIVMPESYVGLPFMDVDTPGKEKAKKESAAAALDGYAKSIVGRRKGVEVLEKGRWPRINSRVIGGFFTDRLITDRPFRVVADRCVRCGVCVAQCQVGNMRLDEQGRPEWLHTGDCLTCFSCYHHCPGHAIEYGGRTKNKGQYYFK